MAMMMMEYEEYEEQDQNKIRGENFFHVLQKIRENDIHFGEQEMTLSLWTDPPDRRRIPSSCILKPVPLTVEMLSEQELIEKLRDQTEKVFELICTADYKPCNESKMCKDHYEVSFLIFDKLIYLDDRDEFEKRMGKISLRGRYRGGVIFRGNLKELLTADIFELVIKPRIEQKTRKKLQQQEWNEKQRKIQQQQISRFFQQLEQKKQQELQQQEEWEEKQRKIQQQQLELEEEQRKKQQLEQKKQQELQQQEEWEEKQRKIQQQQLELEEEQRKKQQLEQKKQQELQQQEELEEKQRKIQQQQLELEEEKWKKQQLEQKKEQDLQQQQEEWKEKLCKIQQQQLQLEEKQRKKQQLIQQLELKEEQQKLKEKELLEDQRKICKKKKQGNNFLKFLICCP